MADSRAELILHPVRMRIIQTVAGREMSAKEIGAALKDVAQATLYRHLNALHEGGVLTVAAERPVRSVTERIYALNTEAANLTGADVKDLSRDEHMRYFRTFVATLLADFARYLESEEVDFEADQVAYQQAPLYLTDQEVRTLMAAFNRLLKPHLANEPGPERRRRLFSTVLLPVE